MVANELADSSSGEKQDSLAGGRTGRAKSIWSNLEDMDRMDIRDIGRDEGEGGRRHTWGILRPRVSLARGETWWPSAELKGKALDSYTRASAKDSERSGQKSGAQCFVAHH